MKHFKNLLKEIRITLTQIILFDVILTSILIFLAVYLILALLNLYPIMAVLPAIIYFIISLTKKERVNKMRSVEDKYDFLSEKLRTAADNANKDNPVINELQEEVMQDIKNVQVSSFLNTKSISYRIFLSIIIAFAIVFASTLNLQFLDLEYLLGEVPKMLENNPLGSKGTAALEEVNLSQDIYGNKNIAALGNEEINIKIKPSNFKVSVRETGDTETRDFDEIFPGDVFVESSENFEENIPVEEQELVQQYFNKITG